MAAWAGVLMLAEQGVVPPWELAPGVNFELVRCQTQHLVDDVFIGTSAGGRIFVQAKHGLDWSTSTRPSSPRRSNSLSVSTWLAVAANTAAH
jgi:hypothetical protein